MGESPCVAKEFEGCDDFVVEHDAIFKHEKLMNFKEAGPPGRETSGAWWLSADASGIVGEATEWHLEDADCGAQATLRVEFKLRGDLVEGEVDVMFADVAIDDGVVVRCGGRHGVNEDAEA